MANISKYELWLFGGIIFIALLIIYSLILRIIDRGKDIPTYRIQTSFVFGISLTIALVVALAVGIPIGDKLADMMSSKAPAKRVWENPQRTASDRQLSDYIYDTHIR